MLTIGIDEVGRGCWAGPLVAGAVLLDKPIVGLNDSKQLSAIRRQKLDSNIRRDAVACGIGWVTVDEIDRLGLTKSVALAMQRALDSLNACDNVPDHPWDVIIDGNINYLPQVTGSRCMIKADAAIPSVSAASIIAKVARDTYMQRISEEYPGYGFDTHVGYGTAAHRHAIESLGVTTLHRKSFKPIREFMDQ